MSRHRSPILQATLVVFAVLGTVALIVAVIYAVVLVLTVTPY